MPQNEAAHLLYEFEYCFGIDGAPNLAGQQS